MHIFRNIWNGNKFFILYILLPIAFPNLNSCIEIQRCKLDDNLNKVYFLLSVGHSFDDKHEQTLNISRIGVGQLSKQTSTLVTIFSFTIIQTLNLLKHHRI